MMFKVNIKLLLCCKLGIEFPKMVDINDQSEILLSDALLQLLYVSSVIAVLTVI